jgi:uncharacterized protein YyaL (SSP411 family)
VLDRPDHVDRARVAARFVRDKLTDKRGALLHRYRDGDAAVDGMLDDYAFFVWGLIELYEAAFDVGDLADAVELTRRMDERFSDPKGGYFMTAKGNDDLIVRSKEIYDGAAPSGNSVAMLNLARIARFTGDMSWDKKARAWGLFAPRGRAFRWRTRSSSRPSIFCTGRISRSSSRVLAARPTRAPCSQPWTTRSFRTRWCCCGRATAPTR